jgi:hypothetical protein
MHYLPYLLLWFLVACVVGMFWGLFVQVGDSKVGDSKGKSDESR